MMLVRPDTGVNDRQIRDPKVRGPSDGLEP
jgi:hypothetical protein